VACCSHYTGEVDKVKAASNDARTIARTGRARLGPIQIDRVSLPQVPELLTRFLDRGSPHQVVTANLQFLGVAHRDPGFAGVVNGSDLVVADGMPLLALSRLQGLPIPHRITGHDLLQISAGLAAREGYSVAFLGAAPGVAQEAARRLREMHPGLGPIGLHQAYIAPNGLGVSPEDEDALVDTLKRTRPHFLFVALGCPKQEFWISRHLHEVGIPICVGVGGTLDVLAGRLKRAPVWMQRTGLEWSYRLAQEPQRLWKRYLLGDLPTLSRVGAAALANRRRTRGAGRAEDLYQRDLEAP
jgi:N-acetylglucosaminyldiphosphoundecaprenol N-acetyl-beta-D-mannosaminyltransferase